MTAGIESLSKQETNSARPHHLRLIFAIARKDLSEIATNTQFIIMGFLPLLIFLIYRLMVSGLDNSSILDIAVYDLGDSQLVTAMEQNQNLELHLVTSEASLQARIEDGEMSGLQIPADFDAAVVAGQEPELTIWLNPADGLTSETIEWQRFLEAEIHKLGQQTLPATLNWIDMETGAFAVDTALNSYLLIVVLTMVFFISGANFVAMLVTEEKEKKIGMVLINSPAAPFHIALGKAAAGTFGILFILTLTIVLNGGLTGNWPLALLYLAITLPISLGIGLLTGSLAKSSKQCSSWLGLGMIIFLIPAWFSNLLTLPEPFSAIFSLLPTHFLVQGLTDALNHTEVVAANGLNLGVWLASMVLVLAITIWRLRRNPTSIIAQT